MKAATTDEEFMAVWTDCRGASKEISRRLNVTERNILARRRRIEERLQCKMQAAGIRDVSWAYHRVREFNFEDGIVIVYSDAHYWPGEPTLAYQALLKLCRSLKPTAIVANGDLIDGAKISRFSPSGWARLPSMKDELDLMQERQAAIVRAAPGAKLFRTIGNHDLRLDRYFVQNAEQFAGLPGTRLSDFLPDWPESWSVRINDTIIKHRFKGGRHADWNNVLHAGCSIVTGHLHNLKYDPIRGYRAGSIYGIETGTLSVHPSDEPHEGGGAFEYGEDNSSHWTSGFAVLTYAGGRLLPPEFCAVEFGKAWFRGKAVL